MPSKQIVMRGIDARSFLDPETDEVTRDLSPNEVCTLLGKGPTLVHKMIKNGMLDSYKVGVKCRIIKRASINALRRASVTSHD